MKPGYPIPSSDLLKLIESTKFPCTGTRMCFAREHRPDCVLAIAEKIQRERNERGAS